MTQKKIRIKDETVTVARPRGGDEKSRTMKIDITVRHVTTPGANIFLELGFPPAEARRLHAASRANRSTRRTPEASADG